MLVRAIDEAAAEGAAVINLSLGTADMQHRAALEAAVARHAASAPSSSRLTTMAVCAGSRAAWTK